jgi:putative hemolysin
MELRKYLFTSSFITVIAIVFVLLIAAGCATFLQKQISLISLDNTGSKVMVANPASQNCINKGGRLEIRKNKIGEYGVCLFEDNRQCEEWTFFRGQCPEGGLKITGYDNDAEIYCAITGGQVEGVGTATPMCKRIDGTYCNAQVNLDGDCPDPNNPNPNAGNVEAS